MMFFFVCLDFLEKGGIKKHDDEGDFSLAMWEFYLCRLFI